MSAQGEGESDAQNFVLEYKFGSGLSLGRGSCH